MKTKYGCNLVQATCVEYQTELPTFSEIGECPSLDDTTKELYDLIGEIKTENDLSALGNLCLEYTTIGGKNIVKNVLLKFEQKICELEDEIDTLKTTATLDKSLVGSGLDFKCLTTECSDEISTYKELFQSMITKICALETQIEAL